LSHSPSPHLFVCVCVCGTRVWSQGLHFEPLCQHFSDFFFRDRVSWTIYLGWLWTLILLLSAFWVTRITGVSHWCLALYNETFYPWKLFSS
jgi:hypothetical protein